MLIYSISNQSELSSIPEWVEWIELRIDLSPGLTASLQDLTAYRVIITDRWFKEGGKSRRSITEKIEFYQTMLNFSNLYFDLEIELLNNDVNIDFNWERLILSYHNFESLVVADIHTKLLQALKLKPYMTKIAQHCDTLREVNELYQLIRNFEQKILWLIMGDYGKLQRLLFSYLESQGTFVSAPGAETVSGQLNLKSVAKYPHFFSSKPYKWGGIIGGEQVYDSLGLEFYNNYFRDNKLEACYLPVSLKESDLEDFFDLIRSSPKLSRYCYGFSLTMPFKKSIPKLFNYSKIANLLIYDGQVHFYNTDKDAFIKIRKKLDGLPIKTVLVYGSGSMAQLALDIFADYHVFLTGRNKTKVLKLASQRKNIEIIDQLSPEIYIDLLINTSPIGMKGESFSQKTGIRKFKYVIDLPYSQEDIPLQKEVQKGRYFSGREFWLNQSERQLQEFKERIEND